MNMSPNELKHIVANIPQTCGVYIFLVINKTPLYIGKAIKLRSRILSHIRNPQKPRFLDETKTIEARQTESEIEALVLEARLIKEHKPRYNVAMRDDKQYFYVAFTRSEFPRIFIAHQFSTKNRSGPFTDGRALKTTLKLLRRVFPYCTCKTPHKRFCLNYHMGRDLGYCCSLSSKLKVQKSKLQLKSQKEYKDNINHIKHILRGKRSVVIKNLEKEMKDAAKKQDFEKAAKLRNQLEGIQNVLAHKKIFRDESTQRKLLILNSKILIQGLKRIEGYDISNIQGNFAVGSMVVFEKNEEGKLVPKKSDYRRFKIKTIKGANDPAMMGEVLARRLRHPEWHLPDLFLIDGGLTQRNAVLAALAKASVARPVFGLAKREEELYTGHSVIRLSSLSRDEELLFTFIRNEAHRFAIGYYRKLHRKNIVH